MFGDILKGVLDWGLARVEDAIAEKRKRLAASMGRVPQGSSALKKQEAEALEKARKKRVILDDELYDELESEFRPGGTD